MSPRVFIDTDVIISSSLSQKGAAYELLDQFSIKPFISNFSIEEAYRTSKKIKINLRRLQKQLKKCNEVSISQNISTIEKKYKSYVKDITDTHVVAGAVASKSRFITTYNLKDYKIEKIKRDLDIIVLTPGLVLQYIRSLN